MINLFEESELSHDVTSQVDLAVGVNPLAVGAVIGIVLNFVFPTDTGGGE